jgi:DNA-binding transcriptional LysR family regulator
MALKPVLDLDLLRTLLFIAEEGSFTRAADRVGRTQSAVTLQVQKLEAIVRRPLLSRSKGGPVELTPHGRMLAERARAMLALNDEALADMAVDDAPATLRIGTSAYYTPFFLDRTLERIRAEHPELTVEVITGRSCQIVPQLRDGAFDIVVSEGGVEPRDWPSVEIWRGPLRWITASEGEVHRRDPLPLSLLPSNCPWRPPWMDDCFWRSAALHALKDAGRAFRIASVTDSLADNLATVARGEAVTVSIAAFLPHGVRVLGVDEGLPPLPDTRVVMLTGRHAPQPLVQSVADIISSTFEVT